MWFHAARFGEAEKERAKATAHSTGREGAKVALAPQVRRFGMSHVSARYSISSDELVKEEREGFKGTVVAKGGMAVDGPVPNDSGSGPS